MPTKTELKELLCYMNKQEIAQQYRVSESTVNRWLKKHNMCKSGWGAGKLDYSEALKIRELYFNNDYTQSKIADIFGVSQSTVNKVINNVVYKEGISLSGNAEVRIDTLQ